MCSMPYYFCLNEMKPLIPLFSYLCYATLMSLLDPPPVYSFEGNSPRRLLATPSNNFDTSILQTPSNITIYNLQSKKEAFN